MRSVAVNLCAILFLAACANQPSNAASPLARPDHVPVQPTVAGIATAPSSADSCPPLPLGAPLLYGPDVTLDPCIPTIRVQPGDALLTVHLPLAASVAGRRWTVKVWGSDANNVTFLPAVDWDTGLMDGMNDIDGDALLETSGGNPGIVIEAFGDTDGPEGPGAPGGPDMPGWMVISR